MNINHKQIFSLSWYHVYCNCTRVNVDNSWWDDTIYPMSEVELYGDDGGIICNIYVDPISQCSQYESTIDEISENFSSSYKLNRYNMNDKKFSEYNSDHRGEALSDEFHTYYKGETYAKFS